MIKSHHISSASFTAFKRSYNEGRWKMGH